MSLSLQRSRVDRLRGDLAELEGKHSDALAKAAKERKEATRIAGGITRNTSEGMRLRKQRDAAKREERAAEHEKKAADLHKRISRKGVSLSSAQRSFERTQEQERRKDERELRRRREEERRHVQALERGRLSAMTRSTGAPFSASATSERETARESRSFEYDVCLSFAGENRDYVEWIAGQLRNREVRVFYDKFETAELWGKNLYEHLDHVYRHAARYCVLFVSEHYARKQWPTHERRSAQARALQEHGEYVLPVRFDDTELPGLPPTVGYVDLREIAPATLVELILEKVGRPLEPPVQM